MELGSAITIIVATRLSTLPLLPAMKSNLY